MKQVVFALSLALMAGPGGCPTDQVARETPLVATFATEGRHPVTFRLVLDLHPLPPGPLEAQTIHVTSWRQDHKTGDVQARTVVRTQHPIPAGDAAQVVIQRGYPMDAAEYVAFQVVARGATTAGTAYRSYHRATARFSAQADGAVIADTLAIPCRAIDE